MKKDFFPKSRKANLVVQELDGEVLIYDLQTDKAMCLNPTSALVWEACDGHRNINEINTFVSQKLNSKGNEDLVWLALDQLKKEKLIENGSEMNNRFEGISRREVVKKIGLTTAIALPIIASLVAPLAINASSACITAPGTCTCPGSGTVGDFCPGMLCSGAQMDCQCQRMDAGGNPNNGNCVP